MASTALCTVTARPTTHDLVHAVERPVIAAKDIAGWVGMLSVHTERAYRKDVDQFAQWLTDRGIDAYHDLTPGDVNTWLTGLTNKDGTPQSSATKARKLSSVLSLYRYLRAEGQTTIDPRPFKPPKVQRDNARLGIDVKTAGRIWKATEGQPRLRALVAVMLLCGLRVAEAVGLTMSDIQERQGARVLEVQGKGDKPRTAVLPPDAVVAIQEWLAIRGEAEGPLFTTRNGTAVDVRRVHREVAWLGLTIGIDGLHPHSLRHGFGIAAAEAGVPVLNLSSAMGHASPATTMIYVDGYDTIASSPVYAVAAAIVGAVERS